jgi:hypothetical protein
MLLATHCRSLVLFAALLQACSEGRPSDHLADASQLGDAEKPVPEKQCGQDPSMYFSAYNVAQLEMYAECTVLVGHFQEDSVTDLQDFAALQHVKKIVGFLNVFRCPGFVTLHGLENLETVEGNLAIHLNDNLTSLRALQKLRVVTGNLFVGSNPKVPQSDVDWLGARVQVGGEKSLNGVTVP